MDAHDGGCMYPGCHAPPPCQCEGHHTDPGSWAFTDRWGQPLGTTRPRPLNPDPLDPWNTTT